ncbi:SDR family oxidoreductase [Pseudomonas silvicola]|nr:SDR family oxidoreductase [Pseudomonas silvicola]
MTAPLVVITGAAGALGRAVAKAFLGDGARVLLIDCNEDVLHSAFARADGEKHFLVIDLTDTAASLAAIGKSLASLGPASVLCNIAGGFTMGNPVHDADPGDWQRMLDLNVSTTLNASRAVVPGMIDAGSGKIINIAAASAVSGKPQMGAYCASKSVVARLTESMALELREHGINVNAVAPSILDTPANRAAMPDADPATWVSTAQLASVMAFLASDAANAIHGAVIPVVGLS